MTQNQNCDQPPIQMIFMWQSVQRDPELCEGGNWMVREMSLCPVTKAHSRSLPWWITNIQQAHPALQPDGSSYDSAFKRITTQPTDGVTSP